MIEIENTKIQNKAPVKKLIIAIASLLTMMLFLSSGAIAETADYDSTATPELTKAKSLLARLDIINAMDKTGFSVREKKGLRKEARSIKGQLKELRGGRYIPVGALIMILIIPLTIYQVTESV
jgi:hypothetical protein